LGNDSSFDQNLINNYNSKVFLVDPTPEAKLHYNKFLKSKNTKFVNCAIYNKNSLSKFYKPTNKEKYISHSLKDFDGKAIYSKKYFYVKTKTLSSICKENKINKNKIEILKLDVEGVGLEIIKNIFLEKIYPKQIHIEIEHLLFEGLADEGVSIFLECANLMNINGYNLVKTKQYGEFLFVRNLKIKKNNYFEWQKNIALFNLDKNVKKFAEEINELKPSSKVLDFGCGGGYILNTFSNIKKYGVEINEDALNVSKKKFIVKKNIDKFRDNFFDLIISYNALDHTDNPNLILNKMYKKLKKNGKVVIICGCQKYNLDYVTRNISNVKYSFSISNIKALFRDNDFLVLKTTTINYKLFKGYKKIKKILPQSIFDILCIIYSVIDKRISEIKCVGVKL
jgi:FkbM family methyltransferase